VYRDGTVVGQPEPLGGGLPSDKGATCAPQ
jgi:hypothetical protein